MLVETRDALLAAFAPRSQRHAATSLAARGVELRFDETVDEVTPDHVRLASGEVLPAQTVDLGRRRAGPPARRGARACPRGARGGSWSAATWRSRATGRVGHRRHRRHPRPSDGQPLPQLAPVAMQSGEHVAKQIGRLLEGKGTQPFSFFDRGTMATIGRRSAVAELPGGVKLHGTAGLAGLARAAPAVPRRRAQPGVGAPQLGLELPDLGPRAPPHPRRRHPRRPRRRTGTEGGTGGAGAEGGGAPAGPDDERAAGGAAA